MYKRNFSRAPNNSTNRMYIYIKCEDETFYYNTHRLQHSVLRRAYQRPNPHIYLYIYIIHVQSIGFILCRSLGNLFNAFGPKTFTPDDDCCEHDQSENGAQTSRVHERHPLHPPIKRTVPQQCSNKKRVERRVVWQSLLSRGFEKRSKKKYQFP